MQWVVDVCCYGTIIRYSQRRPLVPWTAQCSVGVQYLYDYWVSTVCPSHHIQNGTRFGYQICCRPHVRHWRGTFWGTVVQEPSVCLAWDESPRQKIETLQIGGGGGITTLKDTQASLARLFDRKSTNKKVKIKTLDRQQKWRKIRAALGWKRRCPQLYWKTLSVPCRKHNPTRLQKPVS